MKFLSDIVSQLPKKLQQLTLNLDYTKLGETVYNWKYLGEMIKKLPKNLIQLTL